MPLKSDLTSTIRLFENDPEVTMNGGPGPHRCPCPCPCPCSLSLPLPLYVDAGLGIGIRLSRPASPTRRATPED